MGTCHQINVELEMDKIHYVQATKMILIGIIIVITPDIPMTLPKLLGVKTTDKVEFVDVNYFR